MDRQLFYPGEIITDAMLLQTEKNAMMAIGYLANALFGGGPIFSGLTCQATAPASMSVIVGTGSVYSIEDVDTTAYGSLGADTTDTVVKQGINSIIQTLSCPAPATFGQSIVYLVEGAYLDNDTADQVLTYYNSANPVQPFTGPNNNGNSQPTTRQGLCSIQIKAGVPAATGSAVAPAADSGYTSLYTVTVPYGATTITSSNIATVTGAPLLSNSPITVLQNAVNGLGNASTKSVTNNSYSNVASVDVASGSHTGNVPVFLDNAGSIGDSEYPATLLSQVQSLGTAATKTASNPSDGYVASVGLSAGSHTGNIPVFSDNNGSIGDSNYAASLLAQLAMSGASLSSNGYARDNTGMLIQWGQASSSSGTFALNFPAAFPTALYRIFLCGAGTGSYCFGQSAIGLSGFTAEVYNSATGAIASGATYTINYIAIGQ